MDFTSNSNWMTQCNPPIQHIQFFIKWIYSHFYDNLSHFWEKSIIFMEFSYLLSNQITRHISHNFLHDYTLFCTGQRAFMAFVHSFLTQIVHSFLSQIRFVLNQPHLTFTHLKFVHSFYTQMLHHIHTTLNICSYNTIHID